MTWVKDTYCSVKGETDINAEGCATGKFVSQGGILGHVEATGLGVFYGIREMMNTESFYTKAGLTKGVAGKEVIIQGFGNVGYYASKFFTEGGAKITGMVEYNSAVYDPNGLDYADLFLYWQKNRTFDGYGKAKEIELTDPLKFMEKKCDILIPAAVERSINKHNAPRLQCKVLGEAANGPTTFEAERILEEKGVVIIPDALLNGSGVTCSYFEWLKNLDHVAPGRLTKKYEQKSKLKLL